MGQRHPVRREGRSFWGQCSCFPFLNCDTGKGRGQGKARPPLHSGPQWRNNSGRSEPTQSTRSQPASPAVSIFENKMEWHCLQTFRLCICRLCGRAHRVQILKEAREGSVSWSCSCQESGASDMGAGHQTSLLLSHLSSLYNFKLFDKIGHTLIRNLSPTQNWVLSSSPFLHSKGKETEKPSRKDYKCEWASPHVQ